ncbi:MAG: ribonuclease P protein component [Candidatus Sumerlaeaceae bacterium]|nr:ribonuclease P protein component [Candidatus Sumerlaeaceae bacterium]
MPRVAIASPFPTRGRLGRPRTCLSGPASEGRPPGPRRRFRTENRLRRRADYLEVYAKGQVYRRRLAHVFVMPRQTPDLPTRIGLTATRRLGGAVVRNRLKRLAREIFRLALPQLKSGFSIVVNFTHASVRATYNDLRDCLHAVWRQAGVFRDDLGRED